MRRALPSRLIAAALLLSAAPVWARRKAAVVPDAAGLLRKSLDPSAASYEGVMRIEVFDGGLASVKKISVRFRKPGLYRRELLDASGQAAQIVVFDGKQEWIHDKGLGKVWKGGPSDPEIKRLGPDAELDLLAENYDLSSATAAAVAGRPCWELSLRARDGGRLRRRLWIDRKTGLTLASQDYRPQGELASSARFESVSFSKRQAKKLFKFIPPPGAVVVKRLEPDFKAMGEAKAAAGIDPKIPAWLPSGYVFESLDVLPSGERKIIHYRFSDGINVVSLFQCPPRVKLDFGAKSAQTLRVGSSEGTLAWTQEGQALGWTQGRWRFLLVGPLSAETLLRVADSVR